ncbi:MAG TPA: mechanosensitive ion channel domain-containing protein [Flavobacteriaceae bacterium]|nr:mechanosensitive ion channel domain-containing protein [Flavobacteriaceae bacterium]
MEKLETLETYAITYAEQFIAFLPTLLGALAILVIGWFLIKFVVKKIRKLFEKRNYDLALRNFLVSIIDVVLKVLLLVVVISQLGVQTASLIALLGAAGLAIGLALQGSLANFAGGVIILTLKPFRLGDWIEAQSISGSVTEISLFYTKLTTAGNQLAVIPNGQISNDNVINYSVLGKRRDFLTYGISYGSDIKKAKSILMELMAEQENVLKDPAPEVVVEALADNSVNLSARFWATNEDFWGCHFYTIEQAKTRLEAAGIELPFPQRDLHVYHSNSDDKNSGESYLGGN